MSRAHKAIAGFGIAAGLTLGSVVPASAIPSEPTDAVCERFDRIDQRVDRQIDRIEAHIARTERMIERVGPRNARATSRLEAKITRLEGRIERLDLRVVALADACGIALPSPEGEVPGETTPVDDSTPVDEGAQAT